MYGNRYAPILPGSGGGAHAQGRAGNGGGVIWLEATQAMNLDGILSANGLTTVWTASGGGSGGGIFISTPRLTGGATAVLRAEGGGGQLYSATNGGGAGGGGRIAVALNMTPEKRERLLTGEPVSMEIVESLTAFAGSTSVAVGTTGPNYTGAEEHAPGEGTVFFMKGSERGTLILFR